MAHTFTAGYRKLRPVLRQIYTFTELSIAVWFICFRLRQQSTERAMDLTDSFTWEDLPTRDAEIGHLTAAGWIPQIKTYSTHAAVASVLFHSVQSAVRIVRNHETIVTSWYPFDWTISPFFELVNISQVKISFDYQRHNSHLT
jgi:hypothetical protein